MKKFKLNSAVIGLGNVGNEHLNFYKKSSDINEIYIYDKYKQIRKIKDKKKIEITKIENIFQKKIDVISISNFDNGHAEFVLRGIKKNINLFVEKPLSTSFDQLDKIYNSLIFYDYKKLLMCNFVLRESNLLNKIIKQVMNGDFGEIFYFEGDYLYGRLNKILNGWRGKEKNYSVMLGGGVHLIDVMLRVFNKYPYKVKTIGNNLVTKNTSFKQNDFSASLFNFKNGGIAKITANYGCVHNHQHVLKIYGTKKTFIYDDMGVRIYNKRDFNEVLTKFKVNKLYSGKDCLLKKYIKQLNSSKNINKDIIMNEINLMSVALSAEKSLNTKKEVNIKLYKKY